MLLGLRTPRSLQSRRLSAQTGTALLTIDGDRTADPLGRRRRSPRRGGQGPWRAVLSGLFISRSKPALLIECTFNLKGGVGGEQQPALGVAQRCAQRALINIFKELDH